MDQMGLKQNVQKVKLTVVEVDDLESNTGSGPYSIK